MSTGTILDRIVAAKRQEVAEHQARTPLSALERRIAELPPPHNFAGALVGDRVRVIAEVKKASPSRGVLRADLDPAGLARAYVDAGAAALSVLTDRHFQGTLEDLAAVRQAAPGVPVLRKDFVVDPYQLYEARAHGADAALLIVACLSPQELRALLREAMGLWVQCLVEVHTEGELRAALEVGAEVVGINNRDLRTFHTDLAVTERLAPLVPPGRLVVSESGIATREDVERVRRCGVHAVLVGEALVTAPDPGARLRALV